MVLSYYLIIVADRLAEFNRPPHLFFNENEKVKKLYTLFLGIAKLKTRSVSALNILNDIILHIIGMEIEYILCGCILNFLLIRNGEVCVFTYREACFFPEAVWLVLRNPDLNYSFTTFCVTLLGWVVLVKEYPWVTGYRHISLHSSQTTLIISLMVSSSVNQTHTSDFSDTDTQVPLCLLYVFFMLKIFKYY